MTDRIDALLDRMTLDEQAALLAGADFWTTVAIDRLGIPAVKVTDGPNGARGAGGLTDGVPATCFPAAVSLGASWDVEAAAELGIPVGTVKSRSHRAFRRLAGFLEHLGEESA